MQNDNAGFVKKHFEKLLLAGAALFLLVFGALFFTDTLGNPFAVDIQGTSTAPDDVVERLASDAQRLSSRLQTADPVEPVPQIPNYSEQFISRRAAPVSSGQPLPVPLNTPSYALIDADAITIDLPLLYVPPVPLPEAMVADQYAFVLDEGRVERNDVLLGLRRQIGEQRPPDFAMVSVRGFWDQEGWVAELVKNHRQPGFEDAPLPPEVYQNKTFPVGVFLLRQTLDPDTNTWGAFDDSGSFVENAVTRCPPLPAIYQSAIAVGDRPPPAFRSPEEYLEYLRLPELLAVTVRPETPPLAHGDIWYAPGTAPQLIEPDPAAGVQPPQGDPELRNRNRNRNQFDPEDPRFQGQGDPRLPRGVTPPRRQDRSTPPNRFQQGGFGGAPAAPQFGEALQIVPPTGTILVWGHDLTARPGQTYRYKLTVNAVNPLFGFARLPPEQLDISRNQPAVGPGDDALANSPWTEPIEVEPMLEFFVTGGRAGQPATVEVYRRHDGRWHTETFQPAPGDLIGAADVNGQINMDTGAVVVDILTERDDQNTEINSLLLVDETGSMRVRNISDDRRSDRRAELKDRIENQQLAANNPAADPRRP